MTQMMNRFIIFGLIEVLSLLTSIRCQSKHLCQAMEENNMKIDYSLTVPNGTFHKKFIIIKDQYWELEYIPNQDSSNSIGNTRTTAAGKVVVKNPLSQRSDWLSGDYQLAFAVRYGLPSEPNWTQNTIGLMNTKTQTTDWNLFPLNIDELTPKSTKKNSFNSTLDFWPQIAYNSYSRQEQNSVIFIQQKVVKGTLEKEIQGYNTSDLNLGWTNETGDPWFEMSSLHKLTKDDTKKRIIVPPAVSAVTGLHYLKGLFGVLLSGATEEERNGTIMLIERCVMVGPLTEPCNGNITYVYCVTPEADTDPLDQNHNCFPAKLKQLIDCSKNTTTSSMPSPEPQPETTSNQPETSAVDGSTVATVVSDQTTPSPSPAASDAESSGSLWWLWILIVILIVIIVVIVLIVYYYTKNKGKENPTEDAGPEAGPGSRMGSTVMSTRSKDVSVIPSSADNLYSPSVRSNIK